MIASLLSQLGWCRREPFQLLEPQVSTESGKHDGKHDAQDGLRRRKGKPKDGAEGSGSSDDSKDKLGETEKASEDKSPQLNNPLRWFGVLVNPALRQTQNSFNSSKI